MENENVKTSSKMTSYILKEYYSLINMEKNTVEDEAIDGKSLKSLPAIYVLGKIFY